MANAPVSVVIPTWNRPRTLQQTINEIKECDPQPAEVIVHIDAGDAHTESMLNKSHPDVRVFSSQEQVGAPGGRNKLMAEATASYVASFDDDSYPIDKDYFSRLSAVFADHPKAGVLATTVIHRGEKEKPIRESSQNVASFIGCGCALRKEAWSCTAGYLPRPVASHGLEEADLSLQLMERNWMVIHDGRLRVFHDTDLSHHVDPEVTANTIINTALLAYLRYPLQYVGLGIAQYLNRIVWSIQRGRLRGISSGILKTLPALWRHREHRDPVASSTIRAFRALDSPQ